VGERRCTTLDGDGREVSCTGVLSVCTKYSACFWRDRAEQENELGSIVYSWVGWTTEKSRSSKVSSG
jgi:hypothetical protein